MCQGDVIYVMMRLCVCVCVCVCARARACVRVCYMRACIHTFMHSYMHSFTHTHTCIPAYTNRWRQRARPPQSSRARALQPSCDDCLCCLRLLSHMLQPESIGYRKPDRIKVRVSHPMTEIQGQRPQDYVLAGSKTLERSGVGRKRPHLEKAPKTIRLI